MQRPVWQFPEKGIGMVCDAEIIRIGAANVIGTIEVIATSTISTCCTSSGIGMAAASRKGQKLPSNVVVM